MNKHERDQIGRAIWFLHTDQVDGGDYDKGMQILCELIGRKTVQLSDLKPVSLIELMQRPLTREENSNVPEPKHSRSRSGR